jgi:hypothetical protein
MISIKMHPLVGSFAENKDKARDIRINEITPILERGENLIIDFQEVDSITQSFCHALLSELIRNYGINLLDRISFANCSDEVKGIITIVVEYMQ